jgi:sigma-B regulation protein RsbU (phosphoserine phosphatase)
VSEVEPPPDAILTVPSRTEFLGSVRAVAARLAAEAGFEPTAVDQMALAVDEATTNVIRHAYRSAPDRSLEIHFRSTAAEFRIDLLDDGLQVEAAAVPRYELERYAREGRRGGMGVHLMGQIMDSVRFAQREGRNVCCLVKRRPAAGGHATATRRYRGVVEALAGAGSEPGSALRELVALHELLAAVAAGGEPEALLGSALQLVCRELGARGGAIFERVDQERFRLVRRSGETAAEVELAVPPPVFPVTAADGPPWAAALESAGLRQLHPLRLGREVVGLLAIGERSGGEGRDAGLLAGLTGILGPLVAAQTLRGRLKRADRTLEARVFQLRNLFDLTRELTASLDEGTVLDLVATTLLGHLGVTRCAIFLREGSALTLACQRGLRGRCRGALPAGTRLPEAAAPTSELDDPELRAALEEARLDFAVPLRTEGLIALGARPAGRPFGEEDVEFAATIGAQALTALESIRLNRVRLEKQRQDRELEIARDIQVGLFPRARPSFPGLELAAVSRPCHQVGGDYFDLIRLPEGRLGVVVADVAGKGVGASILMASVHAALQARAGTVEPGALIGWLNEFLCSSTRDNKFVTLFYAEIAAAGGAATYVNAGHVPPFLVDASGDGERLTTGGPLLGVLPGARFETAVRQLGPGSLLAVVTDGVTEQLSPREEEYGDARVLGLLRRCRGAGAEPVVEELLRELTSWAGAGGCTDDVTALIVKGVSRET